MFVTKAIAVTSVAQTSTLSLSLVLILLLLLLLKEIISASASERSKALSRALDYAILPLLLGFLVLTILKVVETLYP